MSVTFEEEKGQLLLFSEGNGVSITDSDSMHLSEATLVLEPGGDASLESLRLNMSVLPQGIVPQSNYQSEQGLLSITGDYTPAEYESILGAVEYVSTNQNPDDSSTMRPVVTCRVRDISTNLWSNNLTITITIVAFNDPPVIYLGGPSQLNNSVTLEMGSSVSQITTLGQVQVQDPDTTSVQSIQLVLELETTNGDLIDLDQESLFSPSQPLQQDQNVYSLGTSSHLALGGILPQVGYRNDNPSATVSGTRMVRITAMDVELVTNAGSRLPGLVSQPSFTFIRVGDEPLALTTPADSTTTEQQTPPITTTETNVQDITTTISTSTSVLTDTTGDATESTTAVDTTDTTITTVLACPEELNFPLIPGSTLGLLVYNWTQTSVEEDHKGQPCPKVSMCQVAN